VFYYLALFQIKDTEYFSGEAGVVVPVHVLEEHEIAGVSKGEIQPGLGSLEKTDLPNVCEAHI